jgi:hypothetical protein
MRVLVMTMSLWLQRKNKDGKTYIYAVPFAPMVVIAFFGALVAILLPIVQAVRAWLGG